MCPNNPRVRGLFIMVGLFVFGVVSTIVVERLGLDIACSKAFFVQGGSNGGWVHAREMPWGVLYDYGEIPGIVLAVLALVVVLLSGWRPTLRRYRWPCLVVILAVVVGPGITVNGLLKGYWGRPRPAEVVEFGGPRQYRGVEEPTFTAVGKSFPCGHCSMAFSLSSVAAFYPYHPAASICLLVAGLAYGGVMGVARIAQGGHFLTDVIWSGIIVMMFIALLYYILLRIPEHIDPRAATRSGGDKTTGGPQQSP